MMKMGLGSLSNRERYFSSDLMQPLLQHGVFDGDGDAVADQLQHVAQILVKIAGNPASDPDHSEGFLFLGTDGNVGDGAEGLVFKLADVIGAPGRQLIECDEMLAAPRIVHGAVLGWQRAECGRRSRKRRS